MIKKFAIFVLAAFMAVSAGAQHRKFYNLTADELRVDSVLSEFAETMPLRGQYNDSVYKAEILYPEFEDMTAEEAGLLETSHPSVLPLGSMPSVRQTLVTSRGRSSIVFSFNPFVFRDGRYQKLTGFMLDVKSSPAPRRSHAGDQPEEKKRYPDKSIFASGKWGKISVQTTGITQLTEAVIRSAGFKDLSKVRIFEEMHSHMMLNFFTKIYKYIF